MQIRMCLLEFIKSRLYDWMNLLSQLYNETKVNRVGNLKILS